MELRRSHLMRYITSLVLMASCAATTAVCMDEGSPNQPVAAQTLAPTPIVKDLRWNFAKAGGLNLTKR